MTHSFALYIESKRKKARGNGEKMKREQAEKLLGELAQAREQTQKKLEAMQFASSSFKWSLEELLAESEL